MSFNNSTTGRQYRTALLGRTSKDDPRTITIDIQKKTLRDWSRRDPLVQCIAGEYWDDGVSGKIPLAERPEGKRLVGDVDAGLIDSVAVAYVDRFGRTLLDGLQAVKALEDRGVKLVAVEDGWDARRNDSALYFQFRMMMAEEEHRRIRERMENGKHRSMEKYNAPPRGGLVFGYRLDANGQFVIDPAEYAVVITVFEMAAKGSSNYEIAAWLQTCGVRPGRKYQKRIPGSPAKLAAGHEQARWTSKSVHYMLSNRTYLGERRYGDRVFPCPAMVDEDTWAAVQARNVRKEKTRSQEAETGFLSGRLRCLLCGARYYQSRRKGKRIYHCPGGRAGSCLSKRLPLPSLDKEVWDLVEGFLSDPAELIRKVLATDARASEAQATLDADGERIRAALELLEERVASLWQEQKVRGWSLEMITPGLDAINAERLKLLSQREELRGRRARLLLDKDESALLPAALAGIRSKLHAGLSHAEKYEIVGMLLGQDAGQVETVATGRRHATGRELEAKITLWFKWGESVSAGAPKPEPHESSRTSSSERLGSEILSVVLRIGA